MKNLLTALRLGFGLGVLLAPMSDEELEAISERAPRVAEAAPEKYERGLLSESESIVGGMSRRAIELQEAE